MFASLMPDLVAIRIDPVESVALAARAGFAGVDLRLNRFIGKDLFDGAAFRDELAKHRVRPGYAPMLTGKIGDDDEDAWRAHLDDLPRLASFASSLGYTRTVSVVLPFHEEHPEPANRRRHIERLRACAPILRDHGFILGLEYVSPLTRRAGQPHPFVHTLDGLLDLLDEADQPNVGVMFDSYHWACAHETADDLRRIDPKLVAAVHVCDWVAGRSADEQLVQERELPGETGLIDMDVFLGTLIEMGVDAPVTAEPTNPKWKGRDPEEVAGETGRAVCASLDSARRYCEKQTA